MTISFPRLTAATLLLVGGSIVALSAFAILVARFAIAVGMRTPATTAELALLDDLIAVAPFVGAFGVASLVAAIALLVGSPWADRLATTLAAAAVVLGLFGVTLLLLGNDPFAAVPSDRALDGIGIMGAFAGLYGAVIVALALDGTALVIAPQQAAA